MRFQTPLRGLVSVCVCLLAMASLAGAATIVVPAGGDLQAALNAAQPGDVITLQPGATYVGNFVLPNKGAVNDYITVRSAAPDALLPPPGVRMTPAYAALLPKLRSPNSMSVMRTATATNHWKLMFLEFQANLNGSGDILSLGAGDSSQTQLSQVPYAFMIDRVYVHGDPLVGQKRGIALHSRDTAVINSYVSGCKAIGQDAQAISGFNGPGNYLIENNYIEGAGENFLLGGADPTIPNLVTTNVRFLRNHVGKPLSWRDPIIATPAAPSASAVPGAGSLAAGTYSYKIYARVTGSQTNKATSRPSVQVSATIAAGTTGGVSLSWTPVVGAEDYLVYGRAAGAQNVYWKTTNPYLTDTGAAGTSASPPSSSGTKWTVKNNFELKNAQDVVVEGNVFEHNWVGDQSGYAIVFTPRNQGTHAPWVVVQQVLFQYNLVRRTAGGVNILGADNVAPTQRTNNIIVRHNVFDDLTGATWGSGSRPFIIGDGPDAVTIDHNTIISTNSSAIYFYGGSVTTPASATNSVVTNNMVAHNSYGIMGANTAFGNPTIAAYLPGGTVAGNVLAGGTASRYPAGNYFPTVPAWQGNFVNYAAGDYHLTPGSAYKNAGLDGNDLGADIDTIASQTAIALSGDNRVHAMNSVSITTTELPNGVHQQSYSQSVACTGGDGGCVWQVSESTLPAGIGFDATAGLISGLPTDVQVGSIMLEAYRSDLAAQPRQRHTLSHDRCAGPGGDDPGGSWSTGGGRVRADPDGQRGDRVHELDCCHGHAAPGRRARFFLGSDHRDAVLVGLVHGARSGAGFLGRSTHRRQDRHHHGCAGPAVDRPAAAVRRHLPDAVHRVADNDGRHGVDHVDAEQRRAAGGPDPRRERSHQRHADGGGHVHLHGRGRRRRLAGECADPCVEHHGRRARDCSLCRRRDARCRQLVARP